MRLSLRKLNTLKWLTRRYARKQAAYGVSIDYNMINASLDQEKEI